MSLSARRVLAEFVACGITHIVWLPDSEAGQMYRDIVDTPQLTLVPVAREGESIAIAAGLLVGGAKPIVQIQSTGFYESGDSTRGLAIDLGLPILLMLDYRGWKEDGPLTDSAAYFLEPTLDTWGIPHYLIVDDCEVDRISVAYREAQERGGPVAVLIGVEYE
ncbi:MAG: hypothetical protein U0556_14390 [Dehalococcoidia bacterium]